jgi:hypothetical protein
MNLLPSDQIQIVKNIDKIEEAFKNGDNVTKAFLRNMLLTDDTYLNTSNEIRQQLEPISFVPVYITMGTFGKRLHTPHTISEINGFNRGVFLNVGTPVNYLVDAVVRLEILSPSYFDYIKDADVVRFLKDRKYPYINNNLNMKNALAWLSTPDPTNILIKIITDSLTEKGLIYMF